MSLELKLTSDLKEAMLSKNDVVTETIRAIKTAIKVAQSSKGGKSELNDADIVQILVKQHKQRQDSVSIFVGAGREDLAETERKEIAYIETLLPQDISDAALTTLVNKVISEAEKPNMGLVIKSVKALVEEQGLKVDNRKLSELVKISL